MPAFDYPSGMWPSGITLPSDGIGYAQPFEVASGNLSSANGSIYPVAVPRVDSSGTEINKHIVPYSAQLFYASLDSIKQEYSARGATEPEFHAFLDSAGSETEVLTSWSGMLSMPLENTHYMIEEAQNAISGLVCMSGWADDFTDYFRRVFDYRVLLSSVPSGQRLQNNVSYFNIASGTSVTIDPLDRARSGTFPLSLDDVKHLGSQWGVNSDGSRNYGSTEWAGSGIAVGEQDERSPVFQQHTFMGHFDWLAQSIMWRPPVVESFSSGVYVSEDSYVQYGRGNSALASGGATSQDAWWHANDSSPIPSGRQPNESVNDPLAEGSGTTPNSELYGDLGSWRIGRPEINRLIPQGGYSSFSTPGSTPVSFRWGPTTIEYYEQHKVLASGGQLSSNTKDYSQELTASGNYYDSGTGYSDDDAFRLYKFQSDRHGSITGYEFPALADPNPAVTGNMLEATDPGTVTHGSEVFQTAISWVSPAASGKWEATGSEVQAGSGIAYPVGSGSEIVIEVEIDSHEAPQGWTSLNGRTDWAGLHLCVQTNKHLPDTLENTSNGSYARAGFDELEIGGSLDLVDSWVEGSNNSQFEQLVFLYPQTSYEDDLDGAFNASGQFATSGYDFYKRTPSLIKTYFTEKGHIDPMTFEVGGDYAVDGQVPQTTIMTGSSHFVYGDIGYIRSADSPGWRGNNINHSSLATTTEWSYGIDETRNSASYPSGASFTTLKLSDYTPSGTTYTLPLWTKFSEDMSNLSTAWTSGALGHYSPDADLSDGGNHWKSFSSHVSMSGWDAAVNGADPYWGYSEDTGGATIDSLTLLDLISSGPSHYASVSGVGYSVNSIHLKFPVILGPSGIN